MNPLILTACVGLSVGASALAQTPLGTFSNTGNTFATRANSGASNSNRAVIFTRHAHGDYAGWNDGQAAAGTRTLTGLDYILQDQDVSTQDMYNLVVYIGDPAMPDFPDVQNPVVTAGPFMLPVGNPGPGGFAGSTNFATPITVAATEDVYVGLDTAPWIIVGNQAIDGHGIHSIFAEQPMSPPPPNQAWSEPSANASAAAAPSGYYVAVTTPPTGPAFPFRIQCKIQPVVPISGGVATGVTNQVLHPESGPNSTPGFNVQDPGAGTACMFAGLYPDAASPAFNPGRVDDIGQMFYNASMPVGSPVFFLIDFGPFGFEVPASQFVPGSTGMSCLSLATAQSLGFVQLDANFRAHRITTFPASVRPLLAGINFVQQAVGYDTSNNTLHSTACTIQRL